MVRALLLGTMAIVLWAANANADSIVGRASVIDGDTIEIQGEEIRLLGIDAPEPNQTCWNASGEPWPCGEVATKALFAKIGDRSTACRGIRRDRQKRLIAICHAGYENLNAWLAYEGWALAYRPHSTAFVAAEEAARDGARGLWAGAFEPPWIWRTKN
jgi:endonuclease YncB( thermonuclease family)